MLSCEIRSAVWRSSLGVDTRTRDSLFLAFALAFGIESVNRAATLGFGAFNEASPWTYIIRLFAFLIILAAVIKKNYGTTG